MIYGGYGWKELDCLRNLRELRADGNKIRSIDGLERLESLVKLSLQSNQVRNVDLTGFRWCVQCLVIGDDCADDKLQAEIRNVKLKPEPAGEHPRVEDARGIDRLESRYVRRHEICCLQFCACPTVSMVGRQSSSARRALFHFDAAVGMMYSQALTVFVLYIQTTMD